MLGSKLRRKSVEVGQVGCSDRHACLGQLNFDKVVLGKLHLLIMD